MAVVLKTSRIGYDIAVIFCRVVPRPDLQYLAIISAFYAFLEFTLTDRAIALRPTGEIAPVFRARFTLLRHLTQSPGQHCSTRRRVQPQTCGRKAAPRRHITAAPGMCRCRTSLFAYQSEHIPGVERSCRSRRLVTLCSKFTEEASPDDGASHRAEGRASRPAATLHRRSLWSPLQPTTSRFRLAPPSHH